MYLTQMSEIHFSIIDLGVVPLKIIMGGSIFFVAVSEKTAVS